jgi:predicted DCC family thiol-disulfide oxidoreductase YuxK
MNAHYPLTIYFDASCRLCNSEMQNIKIHDADNRIVLIDCSAADFDDTPFRKEGIDRQLMMNRLHMQDASGQWFTGVDAFEVIYRAIGMASIALLWGGRFTKPVAEKLYPWVVEHRYALSKIGLPELFGLWSKQAAKKSDRLSRQCHENNCQS